ncbi:unnamed protein product [Sphagnum balticum]
MTSAVMHAERRPMTSTVTQAGRKSDGRKLSSRRTNEGPAMAMLSLATLQQRWRCNAQRCCCCGATALLLLRRYGAAVAAARARSDGAVAILAAALLEFATMALLEFVAALCSAAGARNDGVATARRGAMQQRAEARCDAEQQRARARCGTVQRC